jgi:hypothetical protein
MKEEPGDTLYSPYFAYYCIPPIWVGLAAGKTEGASHTDTYSFVWSGVLEEGTHLAVTRDGMVLFNASDSKRFPPVVIRERRNDNTEEWRKSDEQFNQRMIDYTTLTNLHAYAMTLDRKEIHFGSADHHWNIPSQLLSLHKPTAMDAEAKLRHLQEPAHALIHAARTDARLGTLGVYRYREDIASLDKSIAVLNQIFSSDWTDAPRFVELAWRASHRHSSHDFQSCLINCWIAMERILWRKWDKSVAPAATTGSTNKRDLSAFALAKGLLARGVIDDQVFQSVEEVRRARNWLVHEGKAVSEALSLHALSITESLLESELETRLSLCRGVSGHWAYFRRSANWQAAKP